MPTAGSSPTVSSGNKIKIEQCPYQVRKQELFLLIISYSIHHSLAYVLEMRKMHNRIAGPPALHLSTSPI